MRYPFIYRLTKKCGDNVAIFENVYLLNSQNMVFGKNVSVHPMCYIDGNGGLVIGSDTSIAHGVTIMTSEHDYRQPGYTKNAPCILKPVTIGNDVWIGAGARILAGIHIGSHSIIGAGAVVTKEIPEASVAVGIPAKVIAKNQSNLFIGHKT